jgi:hypothetical protein
MTINKEKHQKERTLRPPKIQSRALCSCVRVHGSRRRLNPTSESLLESGEAAGASAAVSGSVALDSGLDETDDAPRMTQLPRVEPKSVFHLSSTPSSMPSSPVGSSMWRQRSSLKTRRTSEGEWWETSAAGAGGEAGCGAEPLQTAAAAGERIWPSA